MTRHSQIMGYLLAIIIALTAQSAAVARTMPDAAGQMVLCTGSGPIMVYFDADGQPTAPPHLCPDYALSLIVSLDVEGIVFAPTGAWRALRVDVATTDSPTIRFGTPKARGPPVLM